MLKPNTNKLLGPPRLAHLKASEYVDCGHISAALFQQYFKFTFVRNPWARLVSEFNYRQQHGDVRYQCSFKKFLFERFPTAELDDYLNAKDYYRHVISQWQFIYDENDNCLVDFVGKFENLQQDFDYVQNQLGLPKVPLPHKNITHGKTARFKQSVFSLISKNKAKSHYSYYYDQESMNYVKTLYEKDIILFNYHFEDQK
ncbi:hypothetical protein GCM10025767_30290 [Thalassotalea piscium]